MKKRNMKKTLSFLLTLTLILALAACGSTIGQGGASSGFALETPPANQPENTAPQENEPSVGTDDSGKKILISYFSATNNTKNIANHLNEILDADLYEIIPETPYTSDDLNYNNSSSRSSQEMDDPNARPAISGRVDNMEQYDIIFLGYPIWWGEAPRIINTFLESYDLSGKRIAPFCTSASSPLGSSAVMLQDFTVNATWLEGRRFSGRDSVSDVQEWVDNLNLNS